MKAKKWVEANGVPLRMLCSWCTHYVRWPARLEGGGAGGAIAAPSTKQPPGFVAARVGAPGDSAAVRIELRAGTTRLDLHWPLVHTHAQAGLLSELSR